MTVTIDTTNPIIMNTELPITEYLSEYLQNMGQSETLLMHQNSLAKEEKGETIYKFGFGQSPFAVPDFIVNALKENASQKAYLNVDGLQSLCEKVARFHQADVPYALEKEQVMIAPGSKILLYTLMAAFKEATVLLPNPTWVSYHPQARLCGHEVVNLACSYEDKWRVQPSALAAHLEKIRAKSKAPILCVLTYPGNPCGLSYSADELEALAAVLRRHQAFVISDEIYGKLNYQAAHLSIAKFYPEGTLITTGLSKWCGAGGWRLGVAIIPPAFGKDFKQTLTGIASEVYSCAAAPVQYAALKAYENSEQINTFLMHQRRILKAIGTYVYTALEAAGIRLYPPQGGFYVFIDFESFREKLLARGIQDSDAMCLALLQETGVALLSGKSFGMPADSLTARLAFVDFDGQEALAIATQNPDLDASQLLEVLPLKKLKKGIEKLTQWLG